MLLLLSGLLHAADPVRGGHTTAAWGAGIGLVGLGLAATDSGPKLDMDDVLALHAGGYVLGTTGGAMIVGGVGRAVTGLRARGLTVPRGAWYAAFGGLAVGGAGAVCMLATTHTRTEGRITWVEGPSVPCTALYVTGLGTTYVGGLVQGIIDDSVMPEGDPDARPEAEPAEEEEGGDMGLRVAPTLLPDRVALTLSGRF